MKSIFSWKIIRWMLAIPLVFGLIQLVPVPRKNPAVEVEVPASAEVRAILHRACYDCHSNQTVWPWYSQVAPISWLLAYDVYAGRDEMNFSTWNRLSPAEQAKMLNESWEKVAEGEMPPWYYRINHRDASLSNADRATLRSWALASLAAASKPPTD